MIITETRGDIIIKYNSEDYNREDEKKANTKVGFITVLLVTISWIGSFMFGEYLENKFNLNVAVSALITSFIIILTLALFCYYYAVIYYKKFIPAYNDIAYLVKSQSVEAGYYKEKLKFIVKYRSGKDEHNSLEKLIRSKVDIYIQKSENLDMSKEINVEFDFTDKSKITLSIENKTLLSKS